MIDQINILISIVENGNVVSIMQDGDAVGKYCKNWDEILDFLSKHVKSK